MILEALISFLPTPADGAVGALNCSSETRKRLAKLSRNYRCPICGDVEALLPKLDPEQKKNKGNDRFRKEIEKLQQLQQRTEGNKEEENGKEDDKKEEEVDDDSKDAKVAEEDSKPSAAAQSPERNVEPAIDAASLERRDTTNSTMSSSSVQVETVSDHEDSAETVGLLDAEDDRSEAAAINQEEQEGNAVEVQAANETDNVLEVESTLWWGYDPLLNLMIVLLAAMCWLLWLKYADLREELASLREQKLLLE